MAGTAYSGSVAAKRQTARVWQHPHINGSAVVEDRDGRLWVVFLVYQDAWARRRSWTQGIELLLPHDDPDGVLKQIGYVEPE